MTNLEKMRSAFSDALGLDSKEVADDLSYGSKRWDSVAHMSLIAALESEFDIMIDTSDVIDMSSFGKAREIIGKYGVDFGS